MNDPARDPQMWTARRLWTTAVIAIVAQVALIIWSSDRTPVQPRNISERAPVQLAANTHSELLALLDPTLFARANPKGFSGPAWMALPAVDFESDNTNNAARWLALAPEQLGSHFRAFVQTNRLSVFSAAPQAAPALPSPVKTAGLPLAANSTVRVEGALAARTVIYLPPPSAQTNTEILRPSEVELQVDARGNPISAALVKSSGLKLADQLAVALARDSRFAPDRDALKQAVENPAAGLTSGRMIFHWHTVPAATPNGPNGPVLNPR
jgi:hypothetical protein